MITINQAYTFIVFAVRDLVCVCKCSEEAVMGSQQGVVLKILVGLGLAARHHKKPTYCYMCEVSLAA
jgi:hypothetical protein